jgi:hypothetical protein
MHDARRKKAFKYNNCFDVRREDDRIPPSRFIVSKTCLGFGAGCMCCGDKMADDALHSRATSQYFSTQAEFLFRVLQTRKTARLYSVSTFSTAFIMGRLLISRAECRAECRATSARRRTLAHFTVVSTVLCSGFVANKTVSCVLIQNFQTGRRRRRRRRRRFVFPRPGTTLSHLVNMNSTHHTRASLGVQCIRSQEDFLI